LLRKSRQEIEVQESTGPLQGLTVVAFEQAVAAPYCTRVLADLGARVIKVERPGVGDLTRHFDDEAEGQSTYFVWLNRNKESVALDVKDPANRSKLDALLDRADVVIQNLAPGSAAQLGLDAATLVAARPRLVAVDMSGYGPDGPNAHRRAYDLLVQSESGSCAATGWPGRPAKPGVPVADIGSALTAATSILAALTARHTTGRGAALSINMFDVTADMLGFALLHARYTGRERPPNGLGSPVVSPYGAYPTRDGRTVVLGTTNDQEWQRLCRTVLDRPDLAEDPAYATTNQRCDRRAELDTVIAAWIAERDAADICAQAESAGIGNAIYRTVLEAVEHPELVERQRWRTVDSPSGPVDNLLPPFACESWATPMHAVPGLGEHTEAVLSELDATTSTETGGNTR
jgi:crotonobetainyl-CoA:carnitine CoA-transferase CaiB-like acyl-CoA transferase